MLILILCLLPGIYTAGAEAAAEQNLLLFYSSDVTGEIEPCG
jgi:hypothetical protein